MDDYLKALLFALAPAVGNFGGGLLAESFKVSRRALSFALHAAAGVVLAVIAVELIPEALGADPPWVPIMAFVLGGLFFMGADAALELSVAAQRMRDRGCCGSASRSTS